MLQTDGLFYLQELSIKTASLNEASKKQQHLEVEVQQRDDLIKVFLIILF